MKISMLRGKGDIPVTCETYEPHTRDMWPSYVCCRPMVGDIVESVNGRKLIIREVVHSIEGNGAVLRLVLSKDKGGYHPESGGGGESGGTNW